MKTKSDKTLAEYKGVLGVYTKSFYSFRCQPFRLLRLEFGFALGVNVFSGLSIYDYQAKIKDISLIIVKDILLINVLFTFFLNFCKTFKLNNTGAKQLAKKLLQTI